jgi:hypothetical protein
MKPRRFPQAGNGEPNKREHQLSMTHHSGLLDLRRIAAVAFALLLAFTLTAAIAAPGADAKKKTKVSLKITTKNQAKLLKDKKLTVKVKSTGKTKVKVQASSGGKNNYFKKKTVKFKKKGTKKVKLKLTSKGSSNLSLCGAKTVKATGKYGKKKAKKKKKLAKDSSRCIKVPLGSNPQNCDFLDTTVCLQPFANDYFTKDAATSTGKQLDLSPDSTPVNTGNSKPSNLAVTDINRADGFSPGNLIVLKVPGLDTPAAFDNSNLVPLSDLTVYDDPNKSVMIIDAATGERHPIWAELDSNPTTIDPSVEGDGGINADPSNTSDVNLILRPAENFEHGKRYIVVFRNLKNANDEKLQAPPAFQTYRDKIITSQNLVEKRRSHMNSVINTAVNKAGVKRSSMYMAWDFTVASESSVTGRATEIRDDAFARLGGGGDTNLADRKIAGDSPDIDVLAYCDLSNTGSAQCGGSNNPGEPGFDPNAAADSPTPNATWFQRTVTGFIRDVPCYLDENGCPSGAEFSFDANGDLEWNPAYTMDVPFQCGIPRSVVDTGAVVPGGTGVYGHGLLGLLSQVYSTGSTREVGNETNSSWCGANWDGFSENDLGLIVSSLADMSNFNKAVDRMQQGFLNFMMISRALAHPDGFADEPAFQMDSNVAVPITPGPAIDTSAGADTRGYYMGISQGGIMGGALTALSPDLDRGILGVPGINYSTLLRRSVDSDEYFKLPGIGLYDSYPNLAERPLLLSLMQLLWDRGEGNGYAHNVTDNPLPNTNSHEVLMRVAVGDHQVSNYTAEVEARTIGAKRYGPTLVPERRWQLNYEVIPEVSTFPAGPGDSFFVYYDGGPPAYNGTVDPGTGTPPLENVPPRPEWGYGDDPHSMPRRAPDAIEHSRTFLDDGTIGACAAASGYCFSNGWDGMAGLP